MKNFIEFVRQLFFLSLLTLIFAPLFLLAIILLLPWIIIDLIIHCTNYYLNSNIKYNYTFKFYIAISQLLYFYFLKNIIEKYYLIN
jgi:hypothetical protein